MNQPTTDHKAIRCWADARGAVPAEVSPRKFDGEPAILRFLFKNASSLPQEMKEISWDHFFALFDLMGLSFAGDGDNEYELLQIEAKSVYRFEGKPM